MDTNAVHPIRIVRLREAQSEEAAGVIGGAFQDDPLCAAACPDPVERARWLRWGFRMGLCTAFRFGHVLGTSARLDGVAGMVAPGAGTLTEEEMADLGYRRARELVGADVWDRAIAAVLAMLGPADRALQEAVPEPHWYLDVIAVEPTRQGQGIGRALLEAVHRQVDADHLPVALLTFQPANVGFYGRYGYVVICEGRALGSEPRWWGMRRNPRRSPSTFEPWARRVLSAGSATTDGRLARDSHPDRCVLLMVKW